MNAQRYLRNWLAISILTMVSGNLVFADIIYVREGGTGPDGESWLTAYGTLQEALADPNLSDPNSSNEIWVAQGTYYPVNQTDPLNPRTATFQMKNDLTIYGGFPPTGEPNLVTRDSELFETILSGDIGIPSDANDNCYHVFYHTEDLALDNSAILDGFTVAEGNAYEPSDPNHHYGGGMYNYKCTPKIINCYFRDNQSLNDGAGIYCENLSVPDTFNVTDSTFSDNTCGINGGGGGIQVDWGKVNINNCTFINNSAQYGGGLYCYNTGDYQSTKITNCRFLGNTATYDGGAFAIHSVTEPSMTNCVFSGNHADQKGGAMRIHDTDMHLTNCSFSENTADDSGGAIFNRSGSDPWITNCILWNNIALTGPQIANESSSPIVTYCDIEGSWSGTGNIDTDPLFVDPYGLDGTPGTEDDDLRLGDGSPCADAGDNDAMPVSITTDLDGNPRYLDDTTIPDTGNGTPPIVDMGAYEYRLRFVVFVKENATGNNDGTSWQDAYTSLQDALGDAQSNPEIIEIWVAQGTYKPTNPIDPNDRVASFQMIDGVGIYGGFDNTGSPHWEDRAPALYETILSGDIGAVGDDSDNSYHVFFNHSSLGSSAILDGFTITGGNTTGGTASAGGMRNEWTNPTNSSTVINCTFSDNTGGGMYNGSSNPNVINCTFGGNTGNGMRNYGSDPNVINCTFSGNTSNGMRNENNSSPTVTNCTFSGNIGNGMRNQGGSSPTVTNCILWGNNEGGDEIYNYLSNPSIAYSDIAGSGGSGSWDTSLGIDDGNNIDADPLFLADIPDQVRLSIGSPCIDTGNNTVVTEPDDLDGRPRIVDGDCDATATVDMGAYEFNWLYLGDFEGDDCDVDFFDFTVIASAWFTEDGQPDFNPVCDIALPADNRIDLPDLQILCNNWLAGK